MRTGWIALLALGATVCLAPAQDKNTRTWTSRSGKTLEAALKADGGDFVVLQKADGKVSRIEKANLSVVDLQYLYPTIRVDQPEQTLPGLYNEKRERELLLKRAGFDRIVVKKPRSRRRRSTRRQEDLSYWEEELLIDPFDGRPYARDGGIVFFQEPDGSLIDVPMERLTSAAHKYVLANPIPAAVNRERLEADVRPWFERQRALRAEAAARRAEAAARRAEEAVVNPGN